MKILFFYIVINLCLTCCYAQEKSLKEIEMKILSKKEGLALIKEFKFVESLELKEDDEHIYYEGNENGFLIYNKFIGDYIFYNSKTVFKNILSNSEIFFKPEVEFLDFEKNIHHRIENLKKILNVEISKSDKIEGLKKIDIVILEKGRRLSDFSDLIMDFFSYYYIVLSNELELKNFKILEENYLFKFYIFSDSKKVQKEIFSTFYKLMIDPDSNNSLYQTADNIVNPLILKIGNFNEAPIKDDY